MYDSRERVTRAIDISGPDPVPLVHVVLFGPEIGVPNRDPWTFPWNRFAG